MVKTVQATDRIDCYKQTSFGSRNCTVYAPYFVSGTNLLKQSGITLKISQERFVIRT